MLLLIDPVLAQNRQEKVIKKIDKLLEKQLKQKDIHNVYLSLYSPSKNFEWQTAKGVFKDGKQVSIDNPFYTASVGKTFTAAAIGILVDQGQLGFEDPIANYLSAEIMKDLHVLNGIDYGDSIQIAHLLQHTSGLADYFGEETDDGSPSIFDRIMYQPDRLWEPKELIAFAKDHFEPYFAPGKGFYYTDTEYVLLGMIIEEISGIPFHDFIHQKIIDPLELNHTYFNLLSKSQDSLGVMAEIYAADLEISTYKSLSADWAGGAIVSTGKDLISFNRALLKGEIVSETTLKRMKDWIPETKGMYYGFGLRKIAFKELFVALPQWEVIGHSGLNGTSMYYCPDLDIYFASTLNQLGSSKKAVMLMVKVLMQLEKL
ncbi:MAG: serine hydrolase [Flavobacteriales bacterium]|nr:serine hydrolase [Flavobacteriales bacterium]